MRHLVRAREHGMDCQPKVVAELGPGDSLGTGLCALLTGSDRYIALDVVPFAQRGDNVAVLLELVELIGQRASIPGSSEFPEVKPFLDDYSFPEWLDTDGRLVDVLDDPRLRLMVDELQNGPGPTPVINYLVPWFDEVRGFQSTVDWIFSQAVLEHVDDLFQTYRAMHDLLRKGGVMTHQIDFRSHSTANAWDGHRAYSELSWKLIRGRRAYLLNRLPLSAHVQIMEQSGFRIVSVDRMILTPTVVRTRLATGLGVVTETDRETSGAFVVAIKA